MAKLAEHGGIVEERISGREFRSPSAQLRVTPLGDVGAALDARPDARRTERPGLPGLPVSRRVPSTRRPSCAEAAKVGRRLSKEGVIGRFALDFVTVLNDRDEWEIYAIEINLRKGGTTHPFLTLQFLTDGAYDAEAGVFTHARGERKCFVASDHVHSPLYRAFTHERPVRHRRAAWPALRSGAADRASCFT